MANASGQSFSYREYVLGVATVPTGDYLELHDRGGSVKATTDETASGVVKTNLLTSKSQTTKRTVESTVPLRLGNSKQVRDLIALAVNAPGATLTQCWGTAFASVAAEVTITDNTTGVGTLTGAAAATPFTDLVTTNGLVVGGSIKMKGCVNAANNDRVLNVLTIDVASDPQVITVNTGDKPLTAEAASPAVRVAKGLMVRNGTTSHQIAIYRAIDGTGQYNLAEKMKVDSFKIDMAANDLVDMEFGFKGGKWNFSLDQDITSGTNTLADNETNLAGSQVIKEAEPAYANTAVNTYIQRGGSEIELMKANISFGSGRTREKTGVGSITATGQGLNTHKVKFDIELYAEDSSAAKDFEDSINGKDFNFTTLSRTTDGNTFVVTLPSVKLAGLTEADKAEDSDYTIGYSDCAANEYIDSTGAEYSYQIEIFPADAVLFV